MSSSEQAARRQTREKRKWMAWWINKKCDRRTTSISLNSIDTDTLDMYLWAMITNHNHVTTLISFAHSSSHPRQTSLLASSYYVYQWNYWFLAFHSSWLSENAVAPSKKRRTWWDSSNISHLTPVTMIIYLLAPSWRSHDYHHHGIHHSPHNKKAMSERYAYKSCSCTIASTTIGTFLAEQLEANSESDSYITLVSSSKVALLCCWCSQHSFIHKGHTAHWWCESSDLILCIDNARAVISYVFTMLARISEDLSSQLITKCLVAGSKGIACFKKYKTGETDRLVSVPFRASEQASKQTNSIMMFTISHVSWFLRFPCLFAYTW